MTLVKCLFNFYLWKRESAKCSRAGCESVCERRAGTGCRSGELCSRPAVARCDVPGEQRRVGGMGLCRGTGRGAGPPERHGGNISASEAEFALSSRRAKGMAAGARSSVATLDPSPGLLLGDLNLARRSSELPKMCSALADAARTLCSGGEELLCWGILLQMARIFRTDIWEGKKGGKDRGYFLCIFLPKLLRGLRAGGHVSPQPGSSETSRAGTLWASHLCQGDAAPVAASREGPWRWRGSDVPPRAPRHACASPAAVVCGQAGKGMCNAGCPLPVPAGPRAVRGGGGGRAEGCWHPATSPPRSRGDGERPLG